MSIKRDCGLLNSVVTVVDYGVFKSWIECKIVYDIATSLWCLGVKWMVSIKITSNSPIDLSIWSLVCSS